MSLAPYTGASQRERLFVTDEANGEPLAGSRRPSRVLHGGREVPGAGYIPSPEDWQRVRDLIPSACPPVGYWFGYGEPDAIFVPLVERPRVGNRFCIPEHMPAALDNAEYLASASPRDDFRYAEVRKRLGMLSVPRGSGEVVTSAGTKLYQWEDGYYRLSPEPLPGDLPGFALGLSNSAKLTAKRVASVEVFPHDVRVKRSLANAATRTKRPGVRRKITCFSRESRNRLLFTARNTPAPLPILVTLTYPGEFPCNGKVVKKHWDIMRKWFVRRGCSGLMLLEFQKRGAPHLHLYMTQRVDKDEIARHWYEVVGSGDINHLRAGTRVERMRKRYAMLMYIVKYLKKQEQKEVPPGFEDVGRFWSLWGGMKITAEQIVSGSLKAVSGVIRLARGIARARRRLLGLKPLRDTGGKGFLLWDVAETFRKQWGKVTGEGDGFWKRDGWGFYPEQRQSDGGFLAWVRAWKREGSPVETLRPLAPLSSAVC